MADAERILNDINRLKAITMVEGEITRTGFTPKYREGAEYAKQKMREAGLEVREDSIGNVIGKLEGEDPSLPVIISGSHLDTVLNAGAYDGIAGFACALEAARMLKESGTKLKHSYEVYGLMEEEGMTFGQCVLGSRYITGDLNDDMISDFKTPDGRTMKDMLTAYRLPDCCEAKRDPEDIAALVELHIEQGPALEAAGTDIGVVKAIVAISQLTINIKGMSGHAGTVPMGMRHDTMTCAAEIISELVHYAEAQTSPAVTATIGTIRVLPDAANIIAGECTFRLDSRSESRDAVENVIHKLEELCKKAEQTRGVKITIKEDLHQLATEMDDDIREMIRSSADELGLSSMDISSGAGHDAMIFKPYFPTAMIFIPNKDGISHNPLEYVYPNNLENGANVILETIKKIDRSF